jgi:hypothetical protein
MTSMYLTLGESSRVDQTQWNQLEAVTNYYLYIWMDPIKKGDSFKVSGIYFEAKVI